MEMFNPPHPGEILLEEYIKPLNFTVSAFALNLGTSRKNLSEIVNEKVGISPEMALKLAKVLGTSPEIWLRLQLKYDLWQAKQKVNLDNLQVISAKRIIA
ncbi:MAG TPA: HigA family addiction module antitoxin [Candidatus Gastranaerophilaceae bacterium]|nr:HigA family addiction module antitoxin [Candidatus Gastranaerophilaceae bacterium]HPT40750.1 HigA family addiction module antitoxin [Candidatus Gastranaerophilaceae bacterium]